MAWKRVASPTSPGDRVLLWFLCLTQPIVREWSRLMGMINLGARPSFRPTLPDILPPKMPLKKTRRLEELAFWSENGAGREEWLHELRGVLDEVNLRYREDDGWRWFDVELSDGESSSLAAGSFSSVTEYHGGNRLLTRVALCVRVRIPLAWFGLPLSNRAMLRQHALEAARRAGLKLMDEHDQALVAK
jgi:hypothetical protein